MTRHDVIAYLDGVLWGLSVWLLAEISAAVLKLFI